MSFLPSTGALSAVSVVSSSDERLKTDWKNLPEDFIEQLAGVKNGTYQRIATGIRESGVAAQSLEPVLKEAVMSDENGMLSVMYGNAALVSVIELAKEILKLRAEIETLKASK